jgi:hypothetical protein
MKILPILLALFLAAPAWSQSKWPADKVIFDDDGTLEDTGARIGQDIGGALDLGNLTANTFTAGDTTPSVAGSTIWKTAGTALIDDFDDRDGEGEFLVVLHASTNTFDCSAGPIVCGVDDFTATTGSWSFWGHDGGNWILMFYGPSALDWEVGVTRDSILEEHINADNPPTDGHYLTYDSTGANFAWVSPPAPNDADYLVGTADGDLSAEIVVGTAPGGELGGTWASPTVDSVHADGAHNSLGSSLSSSTNDITSTASKIAFASSNGEAETFSVNLGSTDNTAVWGDIGTMDFGAIILKGTGAPQWGVGVQSSAGAPINLTEQFHYNSWTALTKTTGQQVVNLDPAVVRMNFCVIKTGTGGYLSRVNPDDSDTIQLPGGSPLSAGVSVDNSASPTQGDYICFLSFVANTWVVTHMRGSWAAGP